MIGAIIVLSIVAFVAICATVMLVVLFRAECRQQREICLKQYHTYRLLGTVEDVHNSILSALSVNDKKGG